MTKPAKPTTIRCYHGGQQDDPRWFTTDRTHAQHFTTFGPVVEYEVTFDPATDLWIDEDQVEADAILSGGGYEADERLQEIIAQRGASVTVVEGWEGSGLCIITTNAEPAVSRR